MHITLKYIIVHFYKSLHLSNGWSPGLIWSYSRFTTPTTNCRKKKTSRPNISQSYFVFYERERKKRKKKQEHERYLGSNEFFGEWFCHNRWTSLLIWSPGVSGRFHRRKRWSRKPRSERALFNSFFLARLRNTSSASSSFLHLFSDDVRNYSRRFTDVCDLSVLRGIFQTHFLRVGSLCFPIVSRPSLNDACNTRSVQILNCRFSLSVHSCGINELIGSRNVFKRNQED